MMGSRQAAEVETGASLVSNLSLIHISEPTRRTPISYAVFCLKKKKKKKTKKKQTKKKKQNANSGSFVFFFFFFFNDTATTEIYT